MLELTIDKIMDYILSEKCINNSEEEIYRFGLECMLLKILHYISYILIGVILHSFFPLLITSCTLVPLRRKAGGFHARTRSLCYVFSCRVVIIVCIINKLLLPIWLEIFGVIIANIVIYTWAPIENENRHLDSHEAKRFRKQTLLILCISDVLCLLLFLCKTQIDIYFMHGIMMVALLMLLEKIKALCSTKA